MRQRALVAVVFTFLACPALATSPVPSAKRGAKAKKARHHRSLTATKWRGSKSRKKTRTKGLQQGRFRIGHDADPLFMGKSAARLERRSRARRKAIQLLVELTSRSCPHRHPNCAKLYHMLAEKHAAEARYQYLKRRARYERQMRRWEAEQRRRNRLHNTTNGRPLTI